MCPQLTGGGWLLLGPEARGAPPWVLECPPPDVGTGASPSSAMRDRYSLSIRALSWADCGGSPPVVLWAANVLHKAKQHYYKEMNTLHNQIMLSLFCDLLKCCSPGILAVRGDVACSTTLGTERGVGDAARL